MPQIRHISSASAISSEPAAESIAINVAAADQVLPEPSRFVYISTGGNLTVRLSHDTADILLSGLIAGQMYPFAISIVRKTGTTAAGVLLF